MIRILVGSFAGVVVLVVVWLLVAGRNFERAVSDDIERIEESEAAETGEFDRLPALLRQYVERSGLSPGESFRSTRIRQEGEIKLGEDAEWQSFTATQWFSVGRPAFVWKPSMPMPVGSVKGVDRLDRDGGRLEMRIFGAIPVANESGPDILKAQLLRYLAELAWVPPAMVANEQISWEQTDPRTLRATASIGDASAEIDVHFDTKGDIVEVESEGRPRDEDGETVERPWGGTFSEYREFDGIRVPTRAEVYWDLPDGRFTYFRARVTNFSTQ